MPKNRIRYLCAEEVKTLLTMEEAIAAIAEAFEQLSKKQAGGNRDVNIMSPFWLITTYLFITLAEIMISPMGQSYVSKVAPPQIQGLMMGGWFAATALGAMSSGLFGKFYSDFAHHQYFLLHSVLSVPAAFLILLFLKKLK